MVSINHVNMDKIQETIDKIKADPLNAKKVTRIEGEWILDGITEPQFRAEIEVEKGKFVLEADQPTSLGGWGTKPGPMHLCMFGLAACYAATFATVAAGEGVQLRKMKVLVESHMDFSKTFGLSDNPIIEEVRWKISLDSDGGEEKIEELRKLAEERCPAVYCLTNPVKMTIEIVNE